MTTSGKFAFLDDLNPAQREAASCPGGPLMIVAGAGSGKTRVLTYRIAYLIRSDVPAEAILALTFTNKAAGEMKSRIMELLGPESRAIWAGTFHSVLARIFRGECHHLGYQRSFSIYDSDESLSLVRSVMHSLNISTQEFNPHAVQSRISAAKNQMIGPRRLAEDAADILQETTAKVYGQYERQLKKNNALDFDDLLLKPLEVFSRRKAVLEKYQYRFRHILVDEYQDTNRVQYQLVRLLSGHHRNICVVGDDAQSIYSFRGADIRNMLEFESDFTDCRIFRLEQNYRSTATILAAANSVIRNNRGQIEKKLWTENSAGGPVVSMRCSDEQDEALRIIRSIEEEMGLRKRDLKDFAVLYRTNAQSRAIEDQLRRKGIPYLLIGSVAFYKRKEIKDVLAYLMLVANPTDERSLLRIINVPPRGIGEVTLSKLSGLVARGETSLFEALSSPRLEGLVRDGVRLKLNGLWRLITKYVGLKDRISINELARSVLEETGLLAMLKDEGTPEALARRENIQELISALSEFSEHHPDALLEDFLEEVSLVSDVDTADFGRNAVTLMTVHAAKGLEFPVVFLAGLEEGVFPIAGSLGSQKELEEERRLMYVGMTRAREALYLLHAGSRYRFGELSMMVRSRFIDEIDPALVLARSEGMEGGRGRGGRRFIPRRPPVAHRAEHDGWDSLSQEDPSGIESLRPRVGLRVVHSSFGRGRIVAIQGDGENARAVVDFESVGRKQLLLRFAGLTTE
jgi:DNA helicase-2/ATP-dependent DNA helicase PcrA